MAHAEKMNRDSDDVTDDRVVPGRGDPFLSLVVKERELAAVIFLEGGDSASLPLKPEIAVRIQAALSSLSNDSDVVAIARCLDVLQRVPCFEEGCDEG